MHGNCINSGREGGIVREGNIKRFCEVLCRGRSSIFALLPSLSLLQIIQSAESRTEMASFVRGTTLAVLSKRWQQRDDELWLFRLAALKRLILVTVHTFARVRNLMHATLVPSHYNSDNLHNPFEFSLFPLEVFCNWFHPQQYFFAQIYPWDVTL